MQKWLPANKFFRAFIATHLLSKIDVPILAHNLALVKSLFPEMQTFFVRFCIGEAPFPLGEGGLVWLVSAVAAHAQIFAEGFRLLLAALIGWAASRCMPMVKFEAVTASCMLAVTLFLKNRRKITFAYLPVQ